MTEHREAGLLELAVYAAVVMVIVDLAASSSFGILELTAAFLLICMISWVWKAPKEPAAFFLSRPTAVKCFFCLLAAYLIWDAVGLLYSPSLAYALPRYQGEALGGCLFAGICAASAQGQDWRSPRPLAQALWWGGLLAAALAVLGGLWPDLFHPPYALRLSLRRDYNVFATALLVGWCCGLWYLGTDEKRDSRFRNVALCAGTVLCLVPVLLSGSRRCLLLLPICMALLLPAWLWREMKAGKGASAAGLLAVTVVILWSATALFHGYMTRQYQRYGPPAGTVEGETSLSDRYDTIADASMLEKRLLIWRAGARTLTGFSAVEWIAGRGAAYDIFLYDGLDDPQLTASYGGADTTGTMSAHNFLLADLLNGGMVKLLLVLGVSASLLCCWIRIIRQDPFYGLLLACLLGIAYFGNLISNRYGLLYDRVFWLAAGLTVTVSGSAEGRDGPCPGFAS